MADETRPPPTDGAAEDSEYTGPLEKTLVLRKALKMLPEDENPITELHLTEPTAMQLSKFVKASNKPGADDIEAAIVYIAENVGFTGPKAKLLMQMSVRDMEDAMEFLGGFTKAGRQAGKSSSPT